MLKRFIRDPLFIFLVAGLALFVGYSVLNSSNGGRDQSIIIVDDARLAVWLQFRNKAFSPDAARNYLASLSALDRAILIDDYTREEALYRHALSLGLDDNDAIIRQRLVQKMDYVALGLAANQAIVSEQDVRSHFEANKQTYRVPASVSFKHIFFAGDDAEAKSRAAYEDIQNGKPAPSGDRFLFRSQYAEAGYMLVSDHLGMKIADTVFGEITPHGSWLPPLFSNYGWHLIWIANRTPSRDPAFNDVAMDVLQDVQRIRKEQARKKASDAIVGQYTIKISNQLSSDQLSNKAAD